MNSKRTWFSYLVGVLFILECIGTALWGLYDLVFSYQNSYITIWFIMGIASALGLIGYWGARLLVNIKGFWHFADGKGYKITGVLGMVISLWAFFASRLFYIAMLQFQVNSGTELLNSLYVGSSGLQILDGAGGVGILFGQKMSVFFQLFGNNAGLLPWFNLITQVLVIIFLYNLLRIMFDSTIAFIGSMIYSISPYMIKRVAVVSVSMLETFLVVFLLWWLALLCKRTSSRTYHKYGNIIWYLLFGFCMGFIAAGNTIGIVIAIISVIALFMVAKEEENRFSFETGTENQITIKTKEEAIQKKRFYIPVVFLGIAGGVAAFYYGWSYFLKTPIQNILFQYDSLSFVNNIRYFPDFTTLLTQGMEYRADQVIYYTSMVVALFAIRILPRDRKDRYLISRLLILGVVILTMFRCSINDYNDSILILWIIAGCGGFYSLYAPCMEASKECIAMPANMEKLAEPKKKKKPSAAVLEAVKEEPVPVVKEESDGESIRRPHKKMDFDYEVPEDKMDFDIK